MYQIEVFKELMAQFISGEITPEDKKILAAMLDNPQYMGELNAILRENYDTTEITSISPEVTKKFIKELRNKMNTSEKTKKSSVLSLFNWQKIAVAASILLVMGLGTLFLIQNSNQSPVVATPRLADDKEPGKTGAILTLSNGSKIVLDSLGNGLLLSLIHISEPTRLGMI